MLLWLATLTMRTACATGMATDWQTPDSIAAAATAAVTASLSDHSDVEIRAVGLDPRIRLARCSEPLTATLQRAVTQGQGIVAVGCAAPTPWRLFVPVRASFMLPVLVTRHGLSRGQIITAEDVVVERRSAASLPYQYLARTEEALGRSLRRTLPPGAVIPPAALEQITLVSRGQQVTLMAEAQGVLVKSDGIALDSAGSHQRVRVKTRSGRTVEGIVHAAGQVRMGR